MPVRSPLSVLAAVVGASALLSLALPAAPPLTAAPERSPALQSLVETEQAFAKMGAAKGLRDAYLEYLSEDSLLFRPGPVPGKMFYRRQPPSRGRTTWAPDFADIAVSGDLGYNAGPFEFREGDGTAAAPTPTPTWAGHFMSLWRKQADGQWKVELDTHIDHKPFTTAVADVKDVATSSAPGTAANDAKPQKERETALLDLDKGYAKEAASGGGLDAILRAHALDDIRVYRPGSFPFVGKAALDAAARADAAPVTMWQPTVARMSTAGDFGYTTGLIPPSAQTTGPARPRYYVRVWKRQASGAWKIALDLIPAS